MSSIDLDPNRPFAGRYRVVRRIAAGGMGAVFEVEHIETQRRRALKVMLPELVADQELRDRFQLEARVTARIDSEYIVDVFDAGIDAVTAMPFLVMELLQGEELGDVLKRVRALAPDLAVAYLRQVASALDKTHAAGIVHRDLKPENLFLTHREDGTPRIKILDFGISKVVNQGTAGAATRSFGTPLYMAPEQVLGAPVTPATDLYSLALIAYTLLVGASYWQEEADKFENAIAFVLHVSRGITDNPLGRASRAGASLPHGFDAWFWKATHVDGKQRFARASELVNELALLYGFGGADLARADNTGPRRASWVDVQATAPESLLPPHAAGTAPGTGFDRQATGPGPAKKSRVGWAVGFAVIAVGGVGGAMVLRSRATVPTAESAAVPPPPIAKPHVEEHAPPPVAASSAPTVSPAAAPPEPASSPVSVTANAKHPGSSGKTAAPAAKPAPVAAIKGAAPAAKPAGPAAPAAVDPAYTRD